MDDSWWWRLLIYLPLLGPVVRYRVVVYCEVVPFYFVKTTSLFCGNYGAILYFSKSHDLTSFPARHLDIGQCPMSNVHVQCPMSMSNVQCPLHDTLLPQDTNTSEGNNNTNIP